MYAYSIGENTQVFVLRALCWKAERELKFWHPLLEEFSVDVDMSMLGHQDINREELVMKECLVTLEITSIVPMIFSSKLFYFEP